MTAAIIGAAIRVHRALGPGLLESVYEECLWQELQDTGLYVARQVEVPLRYGGRDLQHGFRVDLVVERDIAIEVKAVERLLAVHKAQLVTYLKLGRFAVGLLINFGEYRLIDGVVRLNARAGLTPFHKEE